MDTNSAKFRGFPNELQNSKSTAGDSVPVRVRSPAPKRSIPNRGASFWYRRRTRTYLNAAVRWTVARSRLDGNDTLIHSSPVTGAKKQIPKSGICFLYSISGYSSRSIILILSRPFLAKKQVTGSTSLRSFVCDSYF